jgi:hypothetical protein
MSHARTEYLMRELYSFPISETLGHWYLLYHNSRKNKKFWDELVTHSPWYDTGHIKNDTSNDLLLLGVYSLPQ